MDLISRQAAIDIAYPFDDNERNLIDALEDLPTADVRENVRATLRGDHGSYRCTNCNALISDEIDYVLEDYKPIQFCPNCGAQMMRGEQE